MAAKSSGVRNKAVKQCNLKQLRRVDKDAFNVYLRAIVEDCPVVFYVMPDGKVRAHSGDHVFEWDPKDEEKNWYEIEAG